MLRQLAGRGRRRVALAHAGRSSASTAGASSSTRRAARLAALPGTARRGRAPHGRMVFASAARTASWPCGAAGRHRRPRRGGERPAPGPGRPRPRLKPAARIGVPPWQRDGWPLVCCGGVLVAVPASAWTRVCPWRARLPGSVVVGLATAAKLDAVKSGGGRVSSRRPVVPAAVWRPGANALFGG
ncbi:MAG: hypothetical protein IPI40_19110 [Betaproteobacteria bacterium]|nr:hypothetical protein [Betaproteobacteria bacterium]